MALVETSEGNQHFWDQSVQIDNVDDDDVDDKKGLGLKRPMLTTMRTNA